MNLFIMFLSIIKSAILIEFADDDPSNINENLRNCFNKQRYLISLAKKLLKSIFDIKKDTNNFILKQKIVERASTLKKETESDTSKHTYSTFIMSDVFKIMSERALFICMHNLPQEILEKNVNIFIELKRCFFNINFHELKESIGRPPPNPKFWLNDNWIYKFLQEMNNINFSTNDRPQIGNYFTFSRFFCSIAEKQSQSNILKYLNTDLNLEEPLTEKTFEIIEFMVSDLKFFFYSKLAFEILQDNQYQISKYKNLVNSF